METGRADIHLSKLHQGFMQGWSKFGNASCRDPKEMRDLHIEHEAVNRLWSLQRVVARKKFFFISSNEYGPLLLVGKMTTYQNTGKVPGFSITYNFMWHIHKSSHPCTLVSKGRKKYVFVVITFIHYLNKQNKSNNNNNNKHGQSVTIAEVVQLKRGLDVGQVSFKNKIQVNLGLDLTSCQFPPPPCAMYLLSLCLALRNSRAGVIHNTYHFLCVFPQ